MHTPFKRSLLGLVGGLLSLVGSQSVVAAPPSLSLVTAQVATGAPVPTGRAFFWKATSKTNTIYLLGSIHLGAKEFFPLPPEMESAYKAAKTLIVEVDLSKIDQTKMQSLVMANGMYTDGDSLSKHLDKATQAKLDAFCTKNEFPAVAVDHMRPWMATLMVSILPMMKAGMQASLGIDQYFLNKANKDSKKVAQLESAEGQISLLASAPEAAQFAALKQALGGTAGKPEDDTKLANLWMSGDTKAMEAYVNESAKSDPVAMKKLLHDRNPHMADVAAQYLNGTTPALMVVGAAHLIGDDGVVALLQKQGFTVTQVPVTRTATTSQAGSSHAKAS